jgi:radial spoke head protein 9
LSTSEKVALNIALPALLEFEKLSNLLFWGRIRGLKNDYYIAMGMKMEEEYEFPAKKFYWSLDNFVFHELPPMVTIHADKLEGLRNMFEGNPDKKVWEKGEEEEDEKKNVDDDDNQDNKKNDDDQGSLADTEDLEAESNYFCYLTKKC